MSDRKIESFEAYGRTWEGLIAPDTKRWLEHAALGWCFKGGIGDSWTYTEPESRLAAADAACWWRREHDFAFMRNESEYMDICLDQKEDWQELYEAALEAEGI